MYTGPHIITDGLVLSIDPGSLRSYVSGSSTVLNLADTSESGSFNNLQNTTFSSNFGGHWYFDSLTDAGGNDGNFIAFEEDDDTHGDATNALTYEIWINRQGLSKSSSPRIMSTDLSDYHNSFSLHVESSRIFSIWTNFLQDFRRMFDENIRKFTKF